MAVKATGSITLTILRDGARVFTSLPWPPYSVGDKYIDTLTGRHLECIFSRSSGVFVASDWSLIDAQSNAYFAVYRRAGAAPRTVAKEYTKAQLAALVSGSTTPQSRLFYDNGRWNVCTAKKYVTLSALFDDAGLLSGYENPEWQGGYASIAVGQHDHDTLNVTRKVLGEDKWFFPNTEAHSWDTTGQTTVVPCLAVLGAGRPVTTIAADAQAANVLPKIGRASCRERV